VGAALGPVVLKVEGGDAPHPATIKQPRKAQTIVRLAAR
jgi:hypothetical protein